MTLASLPPEIVTMWWITLGVGVVVAIVIVVLLQVLLNAVKDIEANVIRLWETATTVAGNTATTWLLGETGDTLQALEGEAGRHDTFLSRGTEP